ncbi:MAG: hypothetical protein M3445_10830 [Actinomycetota bacterium]|nr:hypothetical protein [Actinomycetota bacterium]
MTFRFRAAVAVALAGVLPSCGNVITTDIIGRTAVASDGTGRPVVLVAVCSGGVDEVRVVEGREGLASSERNPEVATLASSDLQTGLVTINVADPEPPWMGLAAPSRLTRDTLYIASASWSGHDAATSQVSFVGRQLAGLADDAVLVGRGEALPRDAFAEATCTDN